MEKVNVQSPLLFDVKQTATLLNVSERSVWSLISNRELGSIQIGSRRLVPSQMIERFIETRMETASCQEELG